MAGPERVGWRRAFPSRALRRLGWFLSLGTVAIVAGYVMFGAEPTELESGRINPLALVPTGLAVLMGVVALPLIIALFRRPMVGADHYALCVRPGILRTLLLPWARVVEIAAYGVVDEPFLLVRCNNRGNHLGDQPRWLDRSVLRAAIRVGRSRASGPTVAAYDVAVRMDEFSGDPASQLAELAAFAPHHVIVADELT